MTETTARRHATALAALAKAAHAASSAAGLAADQVSQAAERRHPGLEPASAELADADEDYAAFLGHFGRLWDLALAADAEREWLTTWQETHR